MTGVLSREKIELVSQPFLILKSEALRLIPHTLEYQIREAAEAVARGGHCLLPSETVYTIVMDGSKEETVRKARVFKKRELHQREGIIAPPSRFLEKVDFDILEQLNPGVGPGQIQRFFEINYGGLVLPLKRGAYPDYLTKERKAGDERFPTALFVWNAYYSIWDRFEAELVRCAPDVIWVGSSANISNQEPLPFKEACQTFSQYLKARVEDPAIVRHPFKGSYTLVDCAQSGTIMRMGCTNPKDHPEIFERWNKEVFQGQLVIP